MSYNEAYQQAYEALWDMQMHILELEMLIERCEG